MSKNVEDRGLYLVETWSRPGRPLHLAVDAVGGDKIDSFHLEDIAEAFPPGALVVFPGDAEVAALPGGGLRLSTGILWSFLDPLNPRVPAVETPEDRLAVESHLRTQVRRLHERLAWWRGHDGELTAGLRRLVAGWDLDFTVVFDLLDSIPVSGPAKQVTPAPLEHQDLDWSADDPEAIYAWLGDGQGLGALYGEGFQAREEQAEVGRVVADALAGGHALLVEAGTGIGKTLAYLVPLIARVVHHGKRVAISTHTRALQAQILDKDLPRLAPLLRDHRCALLMGRRNYLCLRQRQEFLTRSVENLDDALRAAAFRVWLSVTADGMRHELEDHPLLGSDLRSLFDSADLCLPGLCYESDRCFVQRARRRARVADLLVVNHSLLLHDQRAGNTLLGEVDHLVVDEAHRLPAVTVETHTVGCGMYRLEELDDLLGRPKGTDAIAPRLGFLENRLAGLGRTGEKASALAVDLGRSIARVGVSFTRWWKDFGERVDATERGSRPPGTRIRVGDKDEAFGPLREVTTTLMEDLAEAGATYARFSSWASQLDDLPPGLEDDLAQAAQAGMMLQQLHQDLHFLIVEQDSNWVTWLEPGRHRGVARLGASLLETGEVLRDYWIESSLRPVMTSATLAVGEDFSHMMGELGVTRLRPPVQAHAFPSPFDFHRQSLVLVPGLFPDPSSGAFGSAVGELLSQLAHGVGRKTLGLFTSYKLLREAAEALADNGLSGEAEPGSDLPILLTQRPGIGGAALLSRFRSLRRAMLLGTSTFWEGVDFPGEDLEILVVTKLPFLVPSDPWVEARCDRISARGDNPFIEFMVRDAVLRLRQGFGRLIRRTTDRGVVIILDNRLHTKNYGTTFLSALPVMPVRFGDNAELVEKVGDFFRGSGPDPS